MPAERILTGIGLRLLAIFLLSAMTALVKLAVQRGATLPETMFYRQLASLPVVLAFVAAGPGLASLRTRRFGAHLRRAVVGTMGMVFTFGSVLLLPLAEATVLSFTVPIFATIMGALFLNERVGVHRWGAVIVGFVGVLIVAQPSGGHFPLVGTVVGPLAALFVAVVAILLRQIGQTEPTGTTVFWFATLSLVPLSIAYAVVARAHDPLTWALLIGTGVIGGMGQLALTGAVRFAPVSAVVPMDYSGLIWATLLGWTLFAALPTSTTWLGAPIIIGSGLYIAWRERRRSAPVTGGGTPA
ncbi:DMT family transporter [Sphingomonas sp. BGYR3]|uniref:DMT family transporter n=1 Tax=Sphingomonas sp. BGYR3 TaxID=2975483 RepID=UPI0021A580D1|nr:DMT family transporter [Sphingomonas sp. BGYR3]MDG5489792.1 DMT family transporter [Sphingomonas sp. BGYR3]